jgi:predicted acetyltransferase
MEIRILSEEEHKQAGFIWSMAYSFGKYSEPDDAEPSSDPDFGGTYTCGVFDEAGLQAVVVVNDYRIYLGSEVVVPMGGIGGVASLPASRGKGYAGKCLLYSLEKMRETGHITSMLYPFSFEYYRRYGWEWVGTQRSYKVDTSALQGFPETKWCRQATEADFPAIQSLYETFAKQYRGCLVRPEQAWNRLKHRKNQYRVTYLYEHEGNLEGYLYFEGGKEDKTHVPEFLSLTGRAQRGLVGLLRRHSMQTKAFTWNAPPDDPFWSTQIHWDFTTTLEPAPMGRVVDIVKATEAWKPHTDRRGSVVFALQDKTAPWNTGTWRATFEAGGVEIKPTSETPQISMDIQAFSQVYFGNPSLDALRFADHILVAEEVGYRAFGDLFRGPLMWTNNGF